MTYSPSLADTIVSLLKAALGNGFTYFYGDPIILPQSMLPAIIVDAQRTVTVPAPTGMDRLEHTVVVKIAYNKKDEFNRVANEVPAKRKLEELAEGRDAATGEYATNSVAGILRRNFTLVGQAEGQDLDILYGIADRSGAKQVTIVEEADITATICQTLTLTNRS